MGRRFGQSVDQSQIYPCRRTPLLPPARKRNARSEVLRQPQQAKIFYLHLHFRSVIALKAVTP